MKLHDIQEPGNLSGNELDPTKEIAIGIDLGTTNSLVSISKKQKPYIITGENAENNLIPSLVAYQDDIILVGEEATKNPNYVSSIKRLMGKGIKDITNNMLYKIHQSSDDHIIYLDIEGKIKSPIDISSEILKKLKIQAENHLGVEVKNAVITVPAYFDDAARAATKHSAIIAGLNPLRLINEPTAAALAYGLEKNEIGIYAVYDLGGGTFDVSILKLTKGIFKVLATGGNINLGGDDFDRIIVEYFLGNQIEQVEYKKALLEARRIKEHLTYKESWSGSFMGKSRSISRLQFNNLIQPLVAKTLKIFKQVIKDAGIEYTDLNEVVLVGGSSRVPLIAQSISSYLNIQPLATINPEEIVALGAALQAEALTYGSNKLLLDVTPLSLGIEILGGISEVIIPRNSPLPIEQTRIYTTDRDGQTGFIIHVIQGENEKVSKCRSLAYFELKGLPVLPAGQPRVEITFRVDVDGLLTVSAIELLTGSKQEIEVKPSFGLTEEQILKLILGQ